MTEITRMPSLCQWVSVSLPNVTRVCVCVSLKILLTIPGNASERDSVPQVLFGRFDCNTVGENTSNHHHHHKRVVQKHTYG